MIGIYKFTNKITGESYIGQSVNIQKRYEQHRRRCDNYGIKSEDSYFHRMIMHYGFDNFNFEILEQCSADALNERETYYILHYNSLYPNGYNKTQGGNNRHYRKLSAELVRRIKDDLRSSKMIQYEIANKYGVHYNEISLINVGKMWFDEKESYPIRRRCGTKKVYCCSLCGKELYGKCKTDMCSECYSYSTRKVERPEIDTLIHMVSESSYEAVGRLYGVTGRTIKKWIYNK